MDINSAKAVLLRTHCAAIRDEHRANGMMLQSPPGVGKSDGTRQYCEDLAREMNQPVGLVTFMLATISSVDVRGFMLPVKGAEALGTVFSTPPWMPVKGNTEVVEPDGTWHKPGAWQGDIPRIGVLFLDEYSQAEDEVKKPAAELIYKGNVGTAELPRDWRVVAAGNRMSDRSGVLRELMFIVNRRCLLNVDPSLPAWIAWANNQTAANRPHYLTISFAQKNPDLVFREDVPAGTDPFCTPRTICLLDKDLRAIRTQAEADADKMPLDPIAREVAAGWIGGGAAAQYFTHLKYADELPDMDDIIKNPMRAKLPAGRDAQMVCGYMLAHNVNDKSADPVLDYIGRLNVEMQVLAVRTITAQQERVRAVTNTKKFTDWLIKNKDLLVASRA